MDTPEPPTPEGVDPLEEPLANELQRELVELFQATSAFRAPQTEGGAGRVDIPPEQYAEAMRRQLEIVLEYLPASLRSSTT